MLEIAQPQAVRRAVSFCEAVYDGEKTVEGVSAVLISSPNDIQAVWNNGKIPLLIDPEAKTRDFLKPDVLIDAIIAKINIGTRKSDAPFVIGMGVGFNAGVDVHAVIETNRGHNLGRVIYGGQAEPDTGTPGVIAGESSRRVFRAPVNGSFETNRNIGDLIKAGDFIASVNGKAIEASIGGVIRGLLRHGTQVHTGMKAGDVDPRGIKECCFTVSDKASAIGGGVLEAILARFNT
jgi:xanthine dehydrogenase accessory factor